MKRVLSFLTLLHIGAAAYAQQPTTTKTNNLTSFIGERYHVLKKGKNVKEGEYTAVTGKTTIAKGNYTDGKRTGDWSFYNTKGKLVQTYNYDTETMVFTDTADIKDVKYYIENVKPADVVTIPVKIGGTTYGLWPIIFRGELARVIHFEHPNATGVKYKHTFILNDKGEIVTHEVVATIDDWSKLYKLNDDKYDPYLTRFAPAMLNHHPVKCEVVLLSYATF